MRDPLEIEWQRLLRQCRRQGALETSKHVSDLILRDNYPSWTAYRFSEYLLKRGEFSAAGHLLKIIMQRKNAHPLLDELYGTWLWSTGKRLAAIRFVTRKARLSSKSYLFDLLSSMYSLLGNEKKAAKYLHIASLMAKQELASSSSASSRKRKRDPDGRA
jgi:predicted Zn-dependent protease